MSYLLRVELPDVPGSLGRLASAIGLAGGDINAIEIVEHTADGHAVDDVFLETDGHHGAGPVMPDSIVSACNSLEGVRVLWISRYAAGNNLTRDLEVVEAMTSDPGRALDSLVELLPATFGVDWAMRVGRTEGGVRLEHGTIAAPATVPEALPWPEGQRTGERFTAAGSWEGLLMAACPLGGQQLLVIARRGGPEILDSELARLAHLAALAGSIAR